MNTYELQARRIRPIAPADRAGLVVLWERSVRATHTFLDEADVAFYRPLVADIFCGDELDLWVLTSAVDVPIGFLGLSANRIEALFLEPAYRRQGYGRLLVGHAQIVLRGALNVDVNEQNIAARDFYEALGFVVVGRSPLDETGRPYPLLHMHRETRVSDESEPRVTFSAGGASNHP